MCLLIVVTERDDNNDDDEDDDERADKKKEEYTYDMILMGWKIFVGVCKITGGKVNQRFMIQYFKGNLKVPS